jgi:hypothetical protein
LSSLAAARLRARVSETRRKKESKKKSPASEKRSE